MNSTDLAGPWQIRHDPLSQGLTDTWWKTPPKDGWRNIAVPSAWQSVLGMDANGIAWYRRELPTEVSDWARNNARILIRFESVATYARVWLNETEVGQHLGDYVPFQIDLTDAVKAATGPLTLSVRVDQMQAPRPAKGVVTENGHVTKGFHDVLSAQHAGIWGGVSVRRTGPAAIRPNGLFLDPDPATGQVNIGIELDGPAPTESTYRILDPDGKLVARGTLLAEGHALRASAQLRTALALWSPSTPRLYTAEVQLPGETLSQRFAFRTIETGGKNNSRILLNGRPIQLRGLLHWGHEPKHIAPAPPPDQVRAELQAALNRGFNTMCLCMFYPPESYFDLCDELGMLVWQEHPVWKSRMTPDEIPEYKRMYAEFFKRDRKHPSVIIVSGTCEHDSFDAGLSKWWWEESGKALPRTLRQIQTGFLEWTPPDQTHLYDDHVYDNNGRWVKFIADMDARIAKLPPKPFVMGETIISNHWPDVAAIRKAIGDTKPWWLTHGLDECAAYERELTRRQGADTLARFLKQGDWFAKQHRKFQAEVLRTFERCAGFVTNTIRDVPICRVGFVDDLDRWRFSPDETRPWLTDTMLLLRTPGHLRAFTAGQPLRCELGISNFSDAPIDTTVRYRIADRGQTEVRIAAKPGELHWQPIELAIPDSKSSTAFQVIAYSPNSVWNRWTLAAIPTADPINLTAVLRLDTPPFTDAEFAPEFEERSYSSGWGLPCQTWKPIRQSPAALMPRLPTTANDGSIPPDAKAILTHRLTPQLKDYLERGGRAVLLAGPHAGGIASKWINLWGLLPLAVESADHSWPIAPGESDAVLAMLLHDLTASTTRAIPVDELQLTDHTNPIIRYVYTHDSGLPKLFDAVFAARVGPGLLIASTLDHTTAAGHWFLERLLRYAAEAQLAPAERELDITPFLTT